MNVYGQHLQQGILGHIVTVLCSTCDQPVIFVSWLGLLARAFTDRIYCRPFNPGYIKAIWTHDLSDGLHDYFRITTVRSIVVRKARRDLNI